MADVVKGKDVVLLALKDGSYYPFACAQELTLNETTEVIPTTTINSAKFRTFRTRLSEYSISFSGVMFLKDDINIKWHALEIFTDSIRANGLSFKILFTDAGGNYQSITGTGLITSKSISAVASGLAKWGFEIQGSGEYVLSGLNGAGPSIQQLATPSLSATAVSDTQINLTWSNVSNESGYELQRSTDNATWSTITYPVTDATSYSDTGRIAATLYYYRVRAIGNGTTYSNSNWGTDSETTQSAPGLTQLTTPVLTATAASTSQINLSWTNVSNESSYVLQRSLDNASWSTINSPAGDTTTYNDTGLSAGTTYYYRIQAVGDGVTYSSSNWGSDSEATNGIVTTFTAEWAWSLEDPYMGTGTAPDIIFTGSAVFSNGASIVANTTSMPTDYYLVIKYPATESTKTTWYNTSFNNGSIPDFAFRDIITVGGFKYIIARNPLSMDSSAQTTFS